MRWSRVWRWGWLLLGVSAAAAPPTVMVHRCGEGTAVRYQGQPCPHGEAGARWQPPPGTAPLRPPSAAAPAPPAHPASPPVVRRRAAGPAAALITLQQDPVGCRRMRRLREDSLRRRRRPAGYLVERAWEDRVRDACR